MCFQTQGHRKPVYREGYKGVQKFPPLVAEQIGHYVYILTDPANGERFYVGKGTGDRIFAHVREAVEKPCENEKLQRIRDIKARGQEVRYEVVRYGLSEKEAFEVEAAIIDLFPQLTNEQVGHEADERGLMSVSEIVAKYEAEPIEITEPAILFIVNKGFERNITLEQLYEVTRGFWSLGERRNKAEYAFAVKNSIVRQVYKIDAWKLVKEGRLEAKRQDGWQFSGEIAYDMQRYVGRSVTSYITRGAQNPIRYVNC